MEEEEEVSCVASCIALATLPVAAAPSLQPGTVIAKDDPSLSNQTIIPSGFGRRKRTQASTLFAT